MARDKSRGRRAPEGRAPKTTVLMAVYNDERFVRDAVESVLSQTCRDIRFLVVDDGSTDRTPRLLKRYLRDPRMRVVRQANRGQLHALQAGLALIDTPYFVQLDGDDLLRPDAVEVLQREMERADPSVAMCYANYTLEEHGTGRAWKKRGHPIRTRYDALRYVGAMKPRFYRTSAVRSVGGWPAGDPYDGQYMEDKLLAFRLADGHAFHWIDRDLYVKRTHDRNQSVVAIDEYGRLKKWAVRRALRRWRAPYEPRFRYHQRWVYTDLEPLRLPAGPRAPTRPLASIVIPSRDRREMLRLTLLSLYRQTAEPREFEVIVADDASTDGTAEMLSGLNPPYRLSTVRLARHSYCTGAKNAGLRAAKGDLVIFCDSDNIVSPNFVSGHLNRHVAGGLKTATGVARWYKAFTYWGPGFDGEFAKVRGHLPSGCLDRAERARAAGRPTRLLSEAEILTGAYREWRFVPEWARAYHAVRARWGDALEGCPVPWLFFMGGNQSISRRTLERVGAFDASLTRMGDWELGLRLFRAGGRFEVAPEVEGVLQIHPRTADFRRNLADSYDAIRRRFPGVPVGLLAAHLRGWIDVYDFAVLAGLGEGRRGDRRRLAELSRELPAAVLDAEDGGGHRDLRRRLLDLRDRLAPARELEAA